MHPLETPPPTQAILFTPVVYFMVGFKATAEKFLHYFLIFLISQARPLPAIPFVVVTASFGSRAPRGGRRRGGTRPAALQLPRWGSSFAALPAAPGPDAPSWPQGRSSPPARRRSISTPSPGNSWSGRRPPSRWARCWARCSVSSGAGAAGLNGARRRARALLVAFARRGGHLSRARRGGLRSACGSGHARACTNNTPDPARLEQHAPASLTRVHGAPSPRRPAQSESQGTSRMDSSSLTRACRPIGSGSTGSSPTRESGAARGSLRVAEPSWFDVWMRRRLFGTCPWAAQASCMLRLHSTSRLTARSDRASRSAHRALHRDPMPFPRPPHPTPPHPVPAAGSCTAWPPASWATRPRQSQYRAGPPPPPARCSRRSLATSPACAGGVC